MLESEGMDGDEDEIPPAERARDRRRDHDATAQERAGMRTGLAKQFKQVLDTQRRRALDAEGRLSRDRREPDDDDDEARRERADEHRRPRRREPSGPNG